jgi:hypothetical protein
LIRFDFRDCLEKRYSEENHAHHKNHPKITVQTIYEADASDSLMFATVDYLNCDFSLIRFDLYDCLWEKNHAYHKNHPKIIVQTIYEAHASDSLMFATADYLNCDFSLIRFDLYDCL